MDAQNSDALVAAVTWAEGILLGSVATAAAVVAVAGIGFAMLSGRVDWRRGATVILGCFLLFSARSIAAALAALASDIPPVEAEAIAVPSPPIAAMAPPPHPYDP